MKRTITLTENEIAQIVINHFYDKEALVTKEWDFKYYQKTGYMDQEMGTEGALSLVVEKIEDS